MVYIITVINLNDSYELSDRYLIGLLQALQTFGFVYKTTILKLGIHIMSFGKLNLPNVTVSNIIAG